MQPTIGDKVIFQFGHDTVHATDFEAGQSSTVPAFVVSVSSPEIVNLQVLIDGSQGTCWKTSVHHESMAEPGDDQWRWPSVS